MGVSGGEEGKKKTCQSDPSDSRLEGSFPQMGDAKERCVHFWSVCGEGIFGFSHVKFGTLTGHPCGDSTQAVG